MAKRIKTVIREDINPSHRVTSIGRSTNSRPKNKHARRNWKKYRGQGG